jgi:phosphoglycerate dehydrogenase-like enzyme
LIASYDALVLMGEKVTASSFRDDDRLKLITRMGVGFDRVDVPACTKHDVALTITPDGVRRPMASSVVLMILTLAHRLVEKDRVTRTGPLGWPARLDFFRRWSSRQDPGDRRSWQYRPRDGSADPRLRHANYRP